MCLSNKLAGVAKQLTESEKICPWANHLDIENFKSIKHNMNIFHFLESLHLSHLTHQAVLFEINKVSMPKATKRKKPNQQ